MEQDTITILAVDDQYDNLITLQAVLADALPQANLIMAHSGQAGIDLAEKQNPDVILLDIVMPDMDGFQVCEIIKSRPNLKLIPVLFLTALQTNRVVYPLSRTFEKVCSIKLAASDMTILLRRSG